MFLAEVDIMRRVSHPNIIHYLGCGVLTENDEPYIAVVRLHMFCAPQSAPAARPVGIAGQGADGCAASACTASVRVCHVPSFCLAAEAFTSRSGVSTWRLRMRPSGSSSLR